MRITRHYFASPILNGNSQTDISWWNPSNHAQPFPWKCNRTNATGLGALPYFADLDLRFTFTDAFNNLQLSRSYHYVSGDPIPADSIQLMAVDALGADLFDFFNPPVGDRAADIFGIYVKQTAAHSTVSRNMSGFFMVWQFADSQGNPIAP